MKEKIPQLGYIVILNFIFIAKKCFISALTSMTRNFRNMTLTHYSHPVNIPYTRGPKGIVCDGHTFSFLTQTATREREFYVTTLQIDFIQIVIMRKSV